MTKRHFFIDLANGSTIKADKVSKRGATLFGFDDVSETWMLVTRVIQAPVIAIKHECDDRCVNAQGKTMKCECECSGRNHGKGKISFMCEAA